MKQTPAPAAAETGSEILLLLSCFIQQVNSLCWQERTMTAATPGSSGPNLFSMFSAERQSLYRGPRETFLYSMVAQGLNLGILVYFTSCMIQGPRGIIRQIPPLKVLPIIFSGKSGGGGGNHYPLPASQGNPPNASLADQIVPPTVIVMNETHKLTVPETVVVAPDVKFPDQGRIGDPLSKSSTLSDGSGGPTGIGESCCGGIGSSQGPPSGRGLRASTRPVLRE